jgi:asparagine synthase (glutamine-hydrolysing)
MCGIAGAVDRDGPVELEMVERMARALEHRGPDSRGAFADGCMAFAAQRLAVIDPVGGDQPLASEDRSVVAVVNGEIYNHQQLRAELERAGHRFATGSDCEAIVHLYEELGERCVERLRGMFAFALWDRRRRRLLLARDRVGKKPLFYAREGGRLWFGSGPQAILASGEVRRDVDPEAIDLYLHYQCVPAPRSAFAALRKLPPAHTLTWQDGAVSLRRYWKLSHRNRVPALSQAEACERILHTVLEATRLRLRSDVPVGALLSGGLDSSAVLAAMARLTDHPVTAFSIGFDVDEYDETDSAGRVAERYGVEHHVTRLDSSALELLPRLVWHYGEPFGDSSALATFAVAELARRHVTVVLNGDGGDESFGGYRRYLRHVDGANGQRPQDAYAARRATGYFDEPARTALYAPEFRAQLEERPWLSVVRAPYAASDADTVVERLLDVDMQTYLPDDLLVKMDIATMAHSLEARSPLLDSAVIELAAGLPAAAKIDAGETKRIFKRAMREWLPADIVDRPKMGFRIPIGHWLRESAPQLAGDVLLDPATLERGVFRAEGLRALVDEHRAGLQDHGNRLWALMQLELWYRTYVDSAEPAALALT